MAPKQYCNFRVFVKDKGKAGGFSLQQFAGSLSESAIPFDFGCHATRFGTNSAAVVNVTAIYALFSHHPCKGGNQVNLTNLETDIPMSLLPQDEPT